MSIAAVEQSNVTILRSERSLLETQFQVIYALIMHDIKSRFFGNGLGYIATILWPAAHIAAIVGVYVVVGRLAPYGHDAFLYASVSVTPFIIWSYVSRFTILAAITNKTFLQYPIVKPLDLMLSRVVLETISCFVVVIGLFLALTVAGSEPMPHRLDQAVFAMLSALLLGIGCGIFGSVITMIFPLFNVVFVIIVIIMWAISGVAIDPEGMPTIIGDMLAWNPLLHSIEWMRWAYYDDFPTRLLNRGYVIYFGAVAVFLGLIMERALRVFTTR